MYYYENIKYDKYSIKFCTNDYEILEKIKQEYGCILTFSDCKTNKESKITVIAIKSIKLYNKYFTRIKDNKKSNKKLYVDVRRENIILINKQKQELFFLYNIINDEKVQHVEEIIFGIYGKLLRDDGYYFIHASSVAKKFGAVAMLGTRTTDKSIMLLNLLNNKFNYVSNSNLGIRYNKGDIEVMSIPTRIGIRLEKIELSERLILQLKSTEGYKNEKNNGEVVEKFNLKINEMQGIFNTKVINKIKLKALLELHFIEDFKGVNVIEMDEKEKIESLTNNFREAIYQPVNYIKNMFDNYSDSRKLPANLKNIVMFKIFFGKDSDKQMVNVINDIVSEDIDKKCKKL